MPRDTVEDFSPIPFAKLLPSAPVADEVLRCLIAARKLIDTPDKWHKVGDQTRIISMMSVCAIRACYTTSMDFGFQAARCLEGALPDGWTPAPSPVVHYNDHPTTTHADILALFDRAIAARRG